MHNAVWTGALSASGSMTWWWGTYMAADPTRNRTSPDFPLAPRIFPAVAAYLDGEDWATLGLQRSTLTTSDGLVAFGQGNGIDAFAWVRDGENDFGSGSGPGDLEGRTISGATLTIADMTDGTYDVELWSPYGAGGLLQTISASAAGGDLIVNLPDFTGDVALKVHEAAGANEPPVADDEELDIPEDDPGTSIDVLDGDTDADGDPLSITSISEPEHGTAVLEDGGNGDPADDTIVYTPDPDYFGPDAFTYTVSDGRGGSDTASVTITVTEIRRSTGRRERFGHHR